MYDDTTQASVLDLIELEVVKHNGTWIIQCAVCCCLLACQRKFLVRNKSWDDPNEDCYET